MSRVQQKKNGGWLSKLEGEIRLMYSFGCTIHGWRREKKSAQTEKKEEKKYITCPRTFREAFVSHRIKRPPFPLQWRKKSKRGRGSGSWITKC